MPEKIKDTNIRNAAKELMGKNSVEAAQFLDNVRNIEKPEIEAVLKLEYTELGGNINNAFFREFVARYFHYNINGINTIKGRMALSAAAAIVDNIA